MKWNEKLNSIKKETTEKICKTPILDFQVIVI